MLRSMQRSTGGAGVRVGRQALAEDVGEVVRYGCRHFGPPGGALQALRRDLMRGGEVSQPLEDLQRLLGGAKIGVGRRGDETGGEAVVAGSVVLVPAPIQGASGDAAARTSTGRRRRGGDESRCAVPSSAERRETGGGRWSSPSPARSWPRLHTRRRHGRRRVPRRRRPGHGRGFRRSSQRSSSRFAVGPGRRVRPEEAQKQLPAACGGVATIWTASLESVDVGVAADKVEDALGVERGRSAIEGALVPAGVRPQHRRAGRGVAWASDGVPASPW